MERSQRWNAFLFNFPTAYAQAKPERYANAPTRAACWRRCSCCGTTLPAVLIGACLCCDLPGCIVDLPSSLLSCSGQLSDLMACCMVTQHGQVPQC